MISYAASLATTVESEALSVEAFEYRQ